MCVVRLSFRWCLTTLWILHNVIWILTPNEMEKCVVSSVFSVKPTGEKNVRQKSTTKHSSGYSKIKINIGKGYNLSGEFI